MQLVENITDIIQNICQVEAYLTYAEGEDKRNQMVELIRRGNNFICYNTADSDERSFHFVPSKYIGYKANTIDKHITNRKLHTITGSETDVRINRILGEKIAYADLQTQYHEYCLSLGIPKEKLTKRQHKFWILPELSNLPKITKNTKAEAFEGTIKEVVHKIRERNKTIIRLKKASAKGNLRCEICGFSFFEKYGAIGQDFIEVHHTKPIAEMRPNEKTRIEDLILICSNCHRMIHSKREGITIDKLKSALK